MAWAVKEITDFVEDGYHLEECDPDGPRGATMAERIKTFRSFQWGEEHGLILDKKARLWGCGRTNFGLLGQKEQEFDEIWIKPRQI